MGWYKKMVSACNTITKHGKISMCICEKCGTEFKGSKHNANRYCSYKCYHESRWSLDTRKYTKIDGVWFKGKCGDCGKLVKHQDAKRCLECYKKTVVETKPFFTRKITRGKYVNLHRWVYKELGQPCKCQKCGLESNNSRRFHWANISGQYKKEVDDWARLCASCHKKYDLGLMEINP